MDDETLMALNDTSRLGLRRVHAVRAGKPVDEAELLERLGQVIDLPLLGRLEYEEFGIWHLRIYWREGDDDRAVE